MMCVHPDQGEDNKMRMGKTRPNKSIKMIRPKPSSDWYRVFINFIIPSVEEIIQITVVINAITPNIIC